ncbi:MAG TPA: hypothetical protein VIY28_10655 [Pseudonocardiaceae bacterium]
MREQLIRSHTTTLTCTIDGRSNRVTDHAFAAGQNCGRYRALCGHIVAAAAMVSPDAQPARRVPTGWTPATRQAKSLGAAGRDCFAGWPSRWPARWDAMPTAPAMLSSQASPRDGDTHLRRRVT